ncbi:hypothetical protein M8J77_018615 [Diaphorina citri]|nr:hypothetical protein M8J77_018615 [Diaphorina citri]
MFIVNDFIIDSNRLKVLVVRKASAKSKLTSHSIPLLVSENLQIKTAMSRTLLPALCTLAFVALAHSSPLPQKEGQFFTNEAIRQAQNTQLIPQGAEIQKVQEGIELAAFESIPGNQRINLYEIFGDQVPPEVVNNLQTQVDQIGRN